MPNETARKLKALRDTLGISASDMARNIGISPEAYRYYEYGGKGTTNTPTRHKIDAFLDNHELDFDNNSIRHDVVFEAPDSNTILKVISHKFTPNHAYCIGTKKEGQGGATSFSFEAGFTFIYLRKDGKHHVFREARGGWIRTYTDAQLIGKNILEVSI